MGTTDLDFSRLASETTSSRLEMLSVSSRCFGSMHAEAIKIAGRARNYLSMKSLTRSRGHAFRRGEREDVATLGLFPLGPNLSKDNPSNKSCNQGMTREGTRSGTRRACRIGNVYKVTNQQTIRGLRITCNSAV